MTGHLDFNFPAFHDAAARWRAAGWFIVSPAESFEGKQDLPTEVYFRREVSDLLTVDGIAMLPGWQESEGARFELLIAQKIGLRVFHSDTMGPAEIPLVTTEAHGA
jgi:hypothetical protein